MFYTKGRNIDTRRSCMRHKTKKHFLKFFLFFQATIFFLPHICAGGA